MKTLEEIYQEMRTCFAQRTGLEAAESCDLAVRLYALAAQVYALYAQADWVSRQAFPQTAQGEYLDRHAQLRGLERKQAVAAQGVVRFSAKETSDYDRAIPQGTVCMTAGLIRFVTTQSAKLLTGTLYVDVPVQALEAGSAGNVAAGTILSMAVAPTGIASCTNPQPCTGGGDQEGDEELRERVLESFKRLPNGANAAYYQQQAMSFAQVAAAEVVSRPRGTGTVDVIVSTLYGVPDEELLAELTAYFQARREIAVDVQVKAPETKTVDLSLRIAPEEGWTFEEVSSRVEQAVHEWLNGRLLGRSVLRAEIGNLVYSCEGVANYAIDAPAADVAAQKGILPVLGSLNVEEMA